MTALAQVVVLAGGLGTRMRPRTETVPKFLLPVLGRPFAGWLLPRLARAGFGEALLCTGHLGAQVREYVQDGSAFGLRVRYSDDGQSLLGTGGALCEALPRLAETFVVTYGDSFLPFDYKRPLVDLAAAAKALGAMAVYRNLSPGREPELAPSNARVSGDKVVVYDKSCSAPNLDHIDYGAMALRRSVIEALENQARAEGNLSLSSIQANLARRGEMIATVARRRFFEIGSEAGLLALEDELDRCGELGFGVEGGEG